jgi:GNAT superfamily N-acetyltransferase
MFIEGQISEMSADDTDSRFSVRTSRSDDSHGVTDLLQASYSSLFGPAYSTDVLCQALAVIARANPQLLESGAFFVAEANRGQIVGCGGWSLDYPGTEEVAGTGHVRHFATHPDWLRRGVGRALLSETVSQAADRGITTLECQSSLVAVEFYRSQGFSVVSESTLHLTPGIVIPSVHMRRFIA